MDNRSWLLAFCEIARLIQQYQVICLVLSWSQWTWKQIRLSWDFRRLDETCFCTDIDYGICGEWPCDCIRCRSLVRVAEIWCVPRRVFDFTVPCVKHCITSGRGLLPDITWQEVPEAYPKRLVENIKQAVVAVGLYNGLLRSSIFEKMYSDVVSLLSMWWLGLQMPLIDRRSISRLNLKFDLRSLR